MKLPKIDNATLLVLTKRLSTIPYHLLEFKSFSCQPSPSASTNMHCPVTIINDETRTEVAHNQLAGDMHCYAMLPSDAGVELRGNHVIQFRAASVEDADRINAAAKKRVDDIAHCKKLLIELPIALTNSEVALKAAVDADEPAELSEVGAMVFEQKRIKQETESQKKRLVELDSSPLPKLDRTKFRAHQFFARVSMPFGISNLNGTRYHLLRKDEMLAPIPNLELEELGPAAAVKPIPTAAATSSSAVPMALDA